MTAGANIRIDTIRSALECPITHEIMKNPVIDTCKPGHTFEATAIVRYLLIKQECPLTRLPLRAQQLVPNGSIIDLINIVRENNTTALDPITTPDTSSFLDNLCEDDQLMVAATVKRIFDNRNEDTRREIPTRLPQPLTFSQKVGQAAERYCNTVYPCLH